MSLPERPRLWRLHEHLAGDVFTDTGDECEATTWNEAVSLLLAVEICDGSDKGRRLVARFHGNADTNIRSHHGVYRVVEYENEEARS